MTTSHFSVFPIVVPADRESSVRIVFSAFAQSNPSGTAGWRLFYVRDDGVLPEGKLAGWGAYADVSFSTTNEGIEFTFPFTGEAEHVFLLSDENEGGVKAARVFRLYSLKPDLFRLRPFKGDFHAHSNCSDGADEPELVAVQARREGMDFFALTDHHHYAPSLRVVEFISRLPTNFRCYPGEEVHPADTPLHIINFGGCQSVNADLILTSGVTNAASLSPSRSEYERGVDAWLGDPNLSEQERHMVASAEWCFDRIRRYGGVSIYSHPFWRPCHRYFLPRAVNDAIMARGRFDAVEVLSGYAREEWESNALAVAHFYQYRSAGMPLSTVGVSDLHREESCGWCYSIVFAESPEFPPLAEAIRERRSLAVLTRPDDTPVVVGEFRLVQFALFLLREYFPLHDRLCRTEGALLQACLIGNDAAEEKLRTHSAQSEAELRCLWTD